MISKAQCMELILSRAPEFGRAWEEHRNYWKGEEAGLCNEVSAFAFFVADQINQGKRDNLKTIFDLIEELLIKNFTALILFHSWGLTPGRTVRLGIASLV